MAAPAAPAEATAPAPAPEPPKKPWQAPSPDQMHPYHVVMTERLYQKIDYAWKRGGYKSAKEFVLMSLEAAANEALKKLGEEP